MGYTSSTEAAEPGEGFWLINHESTNRDIFLAGEVVLTASNTAILYPGLNLVGYPYSGAVRLGETALGALTGRVEVLDTTSQPPNASESVFGKGYWVKSLSDECIVWSEIRPYDDVFPSNQEPPAILGVEVLPEGTGVVLSIAAAGNYLDVFYQDVTSTSRFETTRGWKLAAQDVPVGGREILTWTDGGGGERVKANEVLGRYYLVARADVDADADSVPDARARFVNDASPAIEPAWPSIQTESLAVADVEESSRTNAESGVENTGMTNSEPARAIRVGRVIYVDRNRGSDLFTGRAAQAVSGDGPKKTIRSGLKVAQRGDVMVIREGKYPEDLNIAGRDLNVRFEGRVDLSGPVRRTSHVSPSPMDVHTNGLSH